MVWEFYLLPVSKNSLLKSSRPLTKVPASCIKTYYLWSVYVSKDFYYEIVNTAIWIQVEVHLAILCGSVQTYRVLLRGFCPQCCRSPNDDHTTEQEAGSYPPRSLVHSRQGREIQSILHTSDSWVNWEPSISDMSSAYMKGTASRTPSPTWDHAVATLPAGMRQQFPSMCTA